ncbi:uncharacterized protein LOC123501220 [Portunus trituberculatus]|uniref:uncharacterized protein LOC123501220 n=1 Tax=Portunus trituberculatus TaxID=210409 RepID=UPI001E1CC26D|nr:uncharacterized protein LOC123501220 [Portunus trituberculatus]
MADKRSAVDSESIIETKKKARREQKYREVWEKEFPWLRPSRKGSCKALCKKCGVESDPNYPEIHGDSAWGKLKLTSGSCREEYFTTRDFTGLHYCYVLSATPALLRVELRPKPRVCGKRYVHRNSWRSASQLSSVLVCRPAEGGRRERGDQKRLGRRERGETKVPRPAGALLGSDVAPSSCSERVRPGSSMSEQQQQQQSALGVGKSRHGGKNDLGSGRSTNRGERKFVCQQCDKTLHPDMDLDYTP